MATETHRLSEQQWQVVLGSLWVTATSLPTAATATGVRFRLGHGAKQRTTWTGRFAARQHRGVPPYRRAGCGFRRLHAAAGAGELQRTVYLGTGKKTITEEYLKALTPAGAGDLVHGRRVASRCGPRACRNAPAGAAVGCVLHRGDDRGVA